MLILLCPIFLDKNVEELFLSIATFQLSTMFGTATIIENIYRIRKEDSIICSVELERTGLSYFRNHWLVLLLILVGSLIASYMLESSLILVGGVLGLATSLHRIKSTVFQLFGRVFRAIVHSTIITIISIIILILLVWLNLRLLNLLFTVFITMYFIKIIFANQPIVSIANGFQFILKNYEYYILNFFGWISGMGLLFFISASSDTGLIIKYGVFAQLIALAQFVPSAVNQSFSESIGKYDLELLKKDLYLVYRRIGFVFLLTIVGSSLIDLYFFDVIPLQLINYATLFPFALSAIFFSLNYYAALPFVYVENKKKYLLQSSVLGEGVLLSFVALSAQELSLDFLLLVYVIAQYIKATYIHVKVGTVFDFWFYFQMFILIILFTVSWGVL